MVTYLDGSPELPLDIVRRIVNRHKDWPLKLYKSDLPGSASQFRKMLYKANLHDARVWEDRIVCDYPSADDLHGDILARESGLFSDSIPPEYAEVITREFASELRALSYPQKISYNYIGAAGLVGK